MALSERQRVDAACLRGLNGPHGRPASTGGHPFPLYTATDRPNTADVSTTAQSLTERQMARSGRATWRHDVKVNWQLYVLMILPVAWLVIFRYMPMYGAQIAFKRFNAVEGILGSPWVGLRYFERFFTSHQFARVFGNTIILSLYQLIAGFPIPIVLALALNAVRVRWFKKSVQMITYMPHFISVIVLVGMMMQFLSPRIGIVNIAIQALGGTQQNFIGIPRLFRSLYVWSGVWQNAGWGTIIYLAALSAVDPNLHEAATIDGASRFRRIWHIDVPTILPTAVVLLILNTGRIMELGFEKVFLMQNPLNLQVSEIIATYVYKVGLASARADFSYSAAIGLVNSVINFALIVTVNRIARRMGETSLW